MLRLKPFLIGAAAITASIVLLGKLHQWTAGRLGEARDSTRQELGVGFLPVT